MSILTNKKNIYIYNNSKNDINKSGKCNVFNKDDIFIYIKKLEYYKQLFNTFTSIYICITI